MGIRNIYKKITRTEWRLVCITILFLIIVTSIPYILGIVFAPENTTYTGLHAVSPGDGYIYYSYIEQVKEGNILLQRLVTTYDTPRNIISPVWVSVGFLAKVLDLSPSVAFHVARVLSIPFLVLVLYLCIAFFIQKRIYRGIALLLACFAGGLGAFFITLLLPFFTTQEFYYNWPIDLWVSEAHMFTSMLQSPHFIWSWTLLLSAMLCMALLYKTQKWKYSIYAGIVSGALCVFHPYHCVTFAVFVAVWIVIEYISTRHMPWKMIMQSSVVGLCILPSVLYYIYVLSTDWVTAQHALHNITTTPSLLYVVVGFGLPFLFALYGLKHVYKKPEHKFIVIWFITHMCLIYLPLAFQRRLLQGVQFPMIILAVYGCMYVIQKYKMHVNKFVYIVIGSVVLCVGTSVFHLVRDSMLFYEHHSWFYITNDAHSAYNWIENNTDKDATFINPITQHQAGISAFAARKVFVGHSHETPFYTSNIEWTKWIYMSNTNDLHKHDFLKRNNIDYLYYEKNHPSIIYKPDEKSYLIKVYDNTTVSLYKVQE